VNAATTLPAEGEPKAMDGELPRDRDDAVTALFAAHHARLVGLARLLVDDLATAEDVVQDAFTSLYRRWPWVRDPAAAFNYLQTSVANGARSTLRRRRTARQVALGPPPVVPSAEATAVSNDDNRRLLAALRQLPNRQRQVVVLRYYLDQTEAEIAETLSISRGSVKQHAARAINALTSQLEAAR
jgi:RNA polymerase sigma-70 factor (sigma-E family)